MKEYHKEKSGACRLRKQQVGMPGRHPALLLCVFALCMALLWGGAAWAQPFNGDDGSAVPGFMAEGERSGAGEIEAEGSGLPAASAVGRPYGLFVAADVSREAPGPFTDLGRGHWAAPYIEAAAARGILSGFPDGSFRPEEPVTGGQWLKILSETVLAAGREAEAQMGIGGSYASEDGRSAPGIANAAQNGAADPGVGRSYAAYAAADAGSAGGARMSGPSGGHWAAPYYRAALEAGWCSAWDLTEAELDLPLPRGPMAMLTVGPVKAKISPEEYGRALLAAKDLPPSYRYEAQVAKAYSLGLLTGYPDGTFRPDGLLTRAEASAVADRLFRLLAEEGTAGPVVWDGPAGDAPDGGGESGAAGEGQVLQQEEYAPLAYSSVRYEAGDLYEVNPPGYAEGSRAVYLDILAGSAAMAEQMERLRDFLTNETGEKTAKLILADLTDFLERYEAQRRAGACREANRRVILDERCCMLNAGAGSCLLLLFPPGYDQPYFKAGEEFY